ncbi:MAG: TIGR00159 family protein [Sphaerobacteraceae bacterium]|nr:MAG: TIGR00159 family protein [Sphaerobacteraceae bacterium]
MPELPWIFTRLDLRAIVDIMAVALIIFGVLWIARGNRATQLIRGLAILIVVVVGVANIFNLAALNWILGHAVPALIIAVPIIFQPELRRGLEQLGRMFPDMFGGSRQLPQLERAVEEITRASAQLSRLRFGGLMVIERDTGLQEYIDRGVQLDAVITRQLLISIFYPNTPLHDGAAIVRQDRVLAASCVLPLSDNVATGGQLGTRHRAAIGITEESDAIVIIVSEETGQISVAHSAGRLVRNLDQERLRRVLRALLKIDQRDRSERPGRRRQSQESPPDQQVEAGV